MKILISGATGFIGKHLVNHFKDSNDIYIIGRNKNKINRIYPSTKFNRLNAITWEELDSYNAKDFDIVINLAGETINHIVWSKKIKDSILESRINTTKILVDWCIKSPNNNLHLLNASAISIYGLYSHIPQQNNVESTEINNHNYFLFQVAHFWEKEVKKLKESNINYSLMRFAVVLGKDGGAFTKLTLPIKLGLATKIGTGLQPFAWVSIDDLVRSFSFIIEKRILGPINIVTPKTITQDEFTHQLSKIFNRPYLFKAPAMLIKLFLGQMGEELLLKGNYSKPEVLLNSGFIFKHNNLEQLLKG